MSPACGLGGDPMVMSVSSAIPPLTLLSRVYDVLAGGGRRDRRDIRHLIRD